MVIAMPEQLAGRLSVASLNTRGIPIGLHANLQAQGDDSDGGRSSG